MKKIEVDEKCKSCGGSGLFTGMAERDGAAIVCSTCDGSGKHHFVYEYDDFTVRQDKLGIVRVFQANPGNGNHLEDFGGMPIKDWQNGKQFAKGSEDRLHTCPCWFYQIADYEKKPSWKECDESLGYSFPQCPHFAEKYDCWARFDKEAHDEHKARD